jgi:hypothetical protein
LYNIGIIKRKEVINKTKDGGSSKNEGKIIKGY